MLNDKSTKVPVKRFHLNADTIRFRPQNKKLQLPYPIVAVVKEYSFLLRLLKEFKSKFDHIYFQPQNLCNVLKNGIKPLPCKNNLYYLYVFRGCIKNKLKSYQFSVQR